MITIENIKDHEDGSCTISVEMNYDEIIEFAKIGLLKVLVDATKETLETSTKTPQKNNVPCNSTSPTIMCDGCDCWKINRAYSS